MTKKNAKNARTALICVDVQNDFLPGGALGVAEGDQVVEPLLRAATEAELVVASRDYHPDGHVSFTAQGGSWPEHCVSGTAGAELDQRIERAADLIIDKATAIDADAYSAFDGTDLARQLHERGIERVVVGGLATDYCVKATALDALREGFETIVLAHGSRAVNVQPGDEQRALAEIEAAGGAVVRDEVYA